MTKQRQASLLTILLIAGALGFFAWRNPGARAVLPASVTPSGEATPQDAVYSMLDAARSGDVPKYLSAYGGEVATALSRARDESPDFAGYLRDSNAALKGVAVMEPQSLSNSEVRIRVEYVYADRNEIQYFHLEKVSGAWKITRLEAAERINTPVPYGTPVQ